jgi:ubiquinone/menaquinone biosynthesis C-methylase UbiE
MTVPLTCPACSGLLECLTDRCRCPACNREWPIADGIPYFASDPYYWGEISQDRMRSVNQRARNEGWLIACRDTIQLAQPQLFRYITGYGRGDFIDLASIPIDSTILDVGSGWGAISCALAKRCGHVVSIESVPERIEFLRIRAEQEGLSNIQLIQTSFLEIPLPDGAFDLIVLNGVVEWFGVASDLDRPDVLQHRILSRLKKCLKPGGCIYIGIENRFGYRYFLGAKDHTGLSYTSLLPRFLADIVMRKTDKNYRTSQARQAYRTYTYSYWGYRSLLKRVGFSDIRMYAVFPDYNDPAYMVPLEHPRAFRYLVNQVYSGNTWKRKFLRVVMMAGIPLKLHRVFPPCFSIYAYA